MSLARRLVCTSCAKPLKHDGESWVAVEAANDTKQEADMDVDAAAHRSV